MADTLHSRFWQAFQPHTRPLRMLWMVLPCLILLAVLLAWRVIQTALDREASELLNNLHTRAEALAWTIEGAARLASHGGYGNLEQLLEETARQPGVAWIAITSPDGRIRFDSNPGVAGQHLYSPEEMLLLAPERQSKGRFSPDDPAIYEVWNQFAPNRLRRHGRHEAANQVLFVAIDASGFHSALETYAKRLWLTAALIIGALAAMAGLIIYIYSYRLSRKGLQNAISLTRQIIDSYPSGLLVTAPTGQITLHNNKIAQLFHLRPNSPANLRSLGGYDWAHILEELNVNGTIREKRGELSWPGQAPTPFELSAAAITGSDNQILGYLLAIRDLGEIAKLRLKLAEARRLGALSNIASGLAHEIRNPLSSIRGYAVYLASRLEHDLLGKNSANLLVEETDRLNRVLDDLLHIARPRSIEAAPADLRAVIDKALAIIKPDAQSKQLQIDLQAPARAPARIDANALLQALLNILLNAAQILPSNGRIKVTLTMLEADSSQAPLEMSGQNVWRIEIEDNGPGMAANVIENIFTPYFTTRPNGTGLGLPIARQIILAHSGSLSVASVPGHATTFTIFLPDQTHENTDC